MDETAPADDLLGLMAHPAATLLAAQKVYADQVREKTKAAYGKLRDAHWLVCGVLGGVLLRTNGKITEFGITNDERRVLFASFVIGMTLCERAIEEGRYLQAMALLRQEMETVAQIVASHTGRKVPLKQATVAVLGKDIARLYGGLSAAAHVSDHDMALGMMTQTMDGNGLPGPTQITRFYPSFDSEMARRSFALHLLLMARLIEQMSIDYQIAHPEDGFGPDDQKAVDAALDLMKAEGMIESDAAPPDAASQLGSD
jgi:hypothetical protein